LVHHPMHRRLIALPLSGSDAVPRSRVELQFGPFTLDTLTRQLRRQAEEISISPKAFALLLELVECRPNALSKARLLESLWPGTFVVEANLSNLVAEIRAALEDDVRQPRFIRTVHGFGYAFCGKVDGEPRVAAQEPTHLDAANVGHAGVDDDRVRMRAPDEVDRLSARVRANHGISLGSQDTFERTR